MREINFFTPYITTKKPNRVGIHQAIIAFVVMLVLCTSFYGWNFYRIIRYNTEIAEYEALLKNPANVSIVKNYTEIKQKVDIINQYSEAITTVENEIKQRSVISSEYLMKLNSAIPHAIFLESQEISDNKVSMIGISTNMNAIAEYQHNLLNTGLFNDVFVSILSTTNEASNGYKFSVNCVVKGVASNEAK